MNRFRLIDEVSIKKVKKVKGPKSVIILKIASKSMRAR